MKIKQRLIFLQKTKKNVFAFCNLNNNCKFNCFIDNKTFINQFVFFYKPPTGGFIIYTPYVFVKLKSN